VTDRGRLVLWLVPEIESTLERMICDGTVRPPDEQGTPDVIPNLADDVESLSDLVIADRDTEHNR
jgi:hypothetical protein